MIRFIFRTISVFCLALAVMFLIIDATRSVGISEVVWTPLANSWERFVPNTLELSSQWLADTVHPFLNDPVLVTMLSWPTFAVFAGLAVLFYIIGHRRRRRTSVFPGR